MRIKQTYFLSLLCLLIQFKVSAQHRFVQGYIITTTKGDTLRGQIDYLNWNQSPRKILFKDSSGQTQHFSCHDISEFAVSVNPGIEIYRSKNLLLDKSPYKLSDLSNIPEEKNVADTVFANLCLTGKINLYFIRDESDRPHYAVEKNDTGIVELKIRRYIQSRDGVMEMVALPVYKNQLIVLTADCNGNMVDRVATAEYSERDLKNVVTYYNKCMAPNIRQMYSQKKEKVHTYLGLVAGTGFRKERLYSTVIDYDNYLFKPGFNLDLGIWIQTIMPRTNKRLSLRLEAAWNYFNEESRRYTKTNSGYEDDRLNLNCHIIKANILLAYNIPIKKAGVDFFTGFSMGGLMHSTNRITTKTDYLGTKGETTHEGPPLADFQSSFIAGVGVNVKGFDVGFRYYLGPNVDGVYVKSLAHSLNLTFSYGFCINCKEQKTSAAGNN